MMPLVVNCPSCNAFFSVLEDLVPKEGRTMRCNNCGHVWHGMAQEKNIPQKPQETQVPQEKTAEPAKKFQKDVPHRKIVIPKRGAAQEAQEKEKEEAFEEQFDSWDAPTPKKKKEKKEDAESITPFQFQGFDQLPKENFMRRFFRIFYRMAFVIPIRLSIFLVILGGISYGVLTLSCHFQSFIPKDFQTYSRPVCAQIAVYDRMIMSYGTRGFHELSQVIDLSPVMAMVMPLYESVVGTKGESSSRDAVPVRRAPSNQEQRPLDDDRRPNVYRGQSPFGSN